MMLLFYFLTVNAKVHKLQSSLLFYQLNFWLIALLLIIAVYYIFLQNKTIRLIKKDQEEQEKFSHLETEERPNASVSNKNEKGKAKEHALIANENNKNEKETFANAAQEDKNIPSETKKVPQANGQAQTEIKQSAKKNPKGNTFVFSLPKAGEKKQASVGNTKGSITTQKNFIQEKHLQFFVSQKEDYFQVEVQANALAKFFLPKTTLAEMKTNLTFYISKEKKHDKENFYLLNELTAKSPIGFHIGDGKNFLEVHFYCYGPIEIKDKTDFSKHFYLRIYRELAA